jgi:fumarate reductase flavoprotein subunit
MTQQRDVDVIVVGGGGAGMAAAITSADEGASVVLVESERRLGGSTALSGGIFFAAGTSVQREAGIIGDTADDMYEYYTVVNRWRVDPPIVRTLCDHAASDLEWLIGVGVRFPVELLHRTGMERVPRGHRADGNGEAIAAALERACRDRPIDIALGRRVERLVTQDGHVVGVATGDDRLTGGAVVVTCGGFGQNPALLAEHFPRAAAAQWTWSVAAPGSRGDAVALGEQVGAAFDGHDHGLLVPATGIARASQHVPAWVVAVTPQGRRFVDESAYLSVLSQRMIDVGGTCWLVMDQTAREAAGAQPGFGDLCTGGDASAWTPELERLRADGFVHRAGTLEELAALAGFDPAVFVSTIDRYNEGAAAGCDPEYAKPGEYVRPVSTPPFYAVAMRPAVVALTGYGLRIDAGARVLDPTGHPIPGLYAAGEATGNVLGDIYIGSGNSIASAIVFGRIAGRAAARA